MCNRDSFFTIVTKSPEPFRRVAYGNTLELLDCLNRCDELKCLCSEKCKVISMLLANRSHIINQRANPGLKRQVSRYVYEF